MNRFKPKVLIFAVFAFYSTAQASEVAKVVELKRCLIFPEVKLQEMERVSSIEGSFDEIRYELFYKEKITSIVFIHSSFSGELVQKEITTERNQEKVFQIIEQVGNEDYLLKQIQRFIRARAILLCKSEV